MKSKNMSTVSAEIIYFNVRGSKIEAYILN